MNLIETNFLVFKLVSAKAKNWKDHLRGLDQWWEIRDKDDNIVGKFFADEKRRSLCFPDDSILLKLHFDWKGRGQIFDSENNLIAKTNRKIGLRGDIVKMENLSGEEILVSKDYSNILDKNEKTVAELKFKRLKNEGSLNVIDSGFDRKMMLGFAFALHIMIHSGPAGVSNL